ncbi:hypothetical protein B5K08_06350 [Rhizobium leguminosarum bv. trifolii]|uniref:Uncharacterized protein n=1 Tax=Rhizobium leguminosarum bv. trifolii TaxID=386 RepID=A0A3E1BVS5_RHILT|nr:hypothetical protein B5K08_06350 [Rhizobium leguminosarum bv. trifolii]RFB99039.1 hypothetical protein B5K10_06340 [Rhizobium leguminosarum bv. trifolii]
MHLAQAKGNLWRAVQPPHPTLRATNLGRAAGLDPSFGPPLGRRGSQAASSIILSGFPLCQEHMAKRAMRTASSRHCLAGLAKALCRTDIGAIGFPTRIIAVVAKDGAKA